MESFQNLLNQVAIINKKNTEILNATGGKFNMFKVCGVDHYENIHSAIIAEFLNPDGSHGLKAKLLECFIKMFCNSAIKQGFVYENARVITESSTDDGRMDIRIDDGRNNYAIIIENKINAGDQKEQLIRYNIFVEKEAKINYQIFYLTLWGDEASDQSSKGVKYERLSYQTNIIAWLENCAHIAIHLPIVRETINQYINHLKSLTNQDMDTKNQEEIIQLLCKDENLESTFAVGDNFAKMKNHIVNKVFLPELAKICEDLGLILVYEECERVNENWNGFHILKPSWNIFQIWFAFGGKELKDFYIGIHHKDINVRNDDIFEELKKLSIFPRKNNKVVYKNFPTYTYWGKDAMIAIKNGEMAKLFKKEIEKILELTKGLDM